MNNPNKPGKHTTITRSTHEARDNICLYCADIMLDDPRKQSNDMVEKDIKKDAEKNAARDTVIIG